MCFAMLNQALLTLLWHLISPILQSVCLPNSPVTSALRQYVDNKFKVVVHVPRRIRGKHADVHGVYGKFTMSCLKRPAAVVVIKRPAGFDATTGQGWTVVSIIRKSGLQAGKAYKKYVGPDGTYDSKVKAERAGYVAS